MTIAAREIAASTKTPIRIGTRGEDPSSSSEDEEEGIGADLAIGVAGCTFALAGGLLPLSGLRWAVPPSLPDLAVLSPSDDGATSSGELSPDPALGGASAPPLLGDWEDFAMFSFCLGPPSPGSAGSYSIEPEPAA